MCSIHNLKFYCFSLSDTGETRLDTKEMQLLEEEERKTQFGQKDKQKIEEGRDIEEDETKQKKKRHAYMICEFDRKKENRR